MTEIRKLWLRWALANAAGWFAGLALGGLIVSLCLGITFLTQSTIPFIGLALAGGAMGACVGFAQHAVLQDDFPWFERRWVWMSLGGGLIGALAATFASFIAQVSWFLGAAAVGAVLAGSVGAWQWFVLRDYVYPARWWLIANIAGGALCGVVTMGGSNPLLLPLCCGAGALLFGGVTGAALLYQMDYFSADED